MFDGALPDDRRRARGVRGRDPPRPRRFPPRSRDVLPAIARAGETFVPLDALRTAGLAVRRRRSASGRRSTSTHATLRDNALSTCAVVPTLITALWRLRQGLEPVAPRADLAYAANYLYMMQGEVPTAEHAAAVEKYLISTIDHGFNASTFTARVITSTGADLGAAVVGAIGALSGPAARRRAEPRAADARRDRHRRRRRAVAARRGRARRPADGLRPPRVQDRRPALAHAARRRRLARRRQDGARPAHRGDRDQGARRAEARAAGSTRTSSSTPAS